MVNSGDNNIEKIRKITATSVFKKVNNPTIKTKHTRKITDMTFKFRKRKSPTKNKKITKKTIA
jgi:hypothetical protein